MNYQNVQDIWPEILEATETGTLKWTKGLTDSSYVVDITAPDLGTYRLEIECLRTRQDSRGPGIYIYVWDTETNIISSFTATPGMSEYQEYYSNFRQIENSYLNTPKVLAAIVSQLKRKD